MDTFSASSTSSASAGLAMIDAGLGALRAVDFADVDDGAARDVLTALARQEAQLASVKLRVLGAADAAGTAQRAGAASTEAWAAELLTVDGAPMARQVQLATRLSSGSATSVALAQGRISPEKASIIVDADSALPDGLTARERERVELHLLAQASALTPKRLRQVARRALEAVRPVEVVDAHEDGLLVSAEEAALAKARLTLHDNSDGTTSGHFTVPTLVGGMLKKVVEAMCAPPSSGDPRGCGGLRWGHGLVSPQGPGVRGTTGASAD